MDAFERRDQPSKRVIVIVIGAGIAEAQNRVGGRIYTLRTFAPGPYAEAGAMRIPRVHAMDDETRLEEALDDVARIHPGIRDVYEVGASHAWYDDRFANGAFALFEPEQQSQLQAAIVRPEGRILFAGEHCSLSHAWIQGGIESGLRAARSIHEAGAPEAVAQA